MKSSTKKIIKFTFILAIIIFAHDLLFSELSSEKLFFPKLFENDCFHQIFEKDITDEKIISYNCFSELWTSGWYYEIAFFCDEQCVFSLFEFEHQKLQQSEIGKIDHKSISSNFLYAQFKRLLEKHYGAKKANKIVIYYSLYNEDSRGDELWYEPDSQLCLYLTYEF
ncbi:MAG: hypothetical protein VSS75_034985 [Candidatus Parabeggiatoa sp.]|nr:hypothetical protein [Candidatus Parabeggiatoa sp.]